MALHCPSIFRKYILYCVYIKQIGNCNYHDCINVCTKEKPLQNTYSEPVYYGHIGTSQKCPNYQGVLIFQVILHNNVSFGTTARCVDYAGVTFSSILINRFHCI